MSSPKLLALPLVFIFMTLSAKAEDRVAASVAPAPWQAAIVKLKVPVTRRVNGALQHFQEDCTGTIIGSNKRRILTAWHCFDGYRDLANPPKFLWQGTWRALRLLEHGGGMTADWALLESTEINLQDSTALPVLANQPATAENITLAGFSGDAGLGRNGWALTYQENCTVSAQDHAWGHTRCSAYKGASGGPVLVNHQQRAHVIGVISARQDDGITLFAPSQLFYQHLKDH